MKKDEYTCKHFSLALPQGSDQKNVPNLLRYLADTLSKDLPRADIFDITFKNELDVNGDLSPSFTVYYDDES